jgi:hypothetical protein
MPFSFTRGDDPAESAAEAQLAASISEIITAAPRLAKLNRRVVKFGGLRDLVSDGWTPEEVARLVESWPNLKTTSLAIVLSLAVSIRRAGSDDLDHVIVWTHACVEGVPGGRSGPRKLVIDELNTLRERGEHLAFPDVAGRYRQAARSSTLGLAALAAGLSIDETERGAADDSLDPVALRRMAADRGVELPTQ